MHRLLPAAGVFLYFVAIGLVVLSKMLGKAPGALSSRGCVGIHRGLLQGVSSIGALPEIQKGLLRLLHEVSKNGSFAFTC